MPMNDTKFVVNNYEGITVSCSDRQWVHAKRHFVDDSDEIIKRNFKDAIKNPDVVLTSKSHDNREIYVKRTSESSAYHPLFAHVVVAYATSKKGDRVGKFVTAYPEHKEGGNTENEVYRKPTD